MEQKRIQKHIHMFMYKQLIFNKGVKAIQWEKDSPLNK